MPRPNAAVDGLGVVPTAEAASNDMFEPHSVTRNFLLFGYAFLSNTYLTKTCGAYYGAVIKSVNFTGAVIATAD